LKLATAVSSILCISAALLSYPATGTSGQQNSPPLLPPSTPPLPQTFDLPDAWTSDQMPDPAQGLISVDVSVTDKAGKSLSGLAEKDFTLLDNDRKQKIVTFQAYDGAIFQPPTSLELVLVIDELNLLQGEAPVSDVYGNVENFLRANGGVLEKPTMIYRLTEDGLFAMPHATLNGNELAQALEQPARQRRIWSPSMITKGIRVSVKGNGATRDAVARTTRAARETDDSLIALGSIAIEERRKSGRKVMLWLGNGWPIENGSAAGLSDFSIELLTRMREARINLWSALDAYDVSGIATPARKMDGELAADINREPAANVRRELATDVNRGLVDGPKLDAADLRYLSLPVLALRSGGGILDPGSNLAARISERLREAGSDYVLTFDPPRTSVVDEYHHLKIEVDNPDLTTHVSEDYYDEPVFYDEAPARQSVSVKQLQALIAGAHGVPDATLAHQLDGVRLTERLSSAKLETLEESARGKKARAVLEILACRSAFFAPPDDEVIAAPPPQREVQEQMIGKAVAYIDSSIPHLPDLLATRTLVQYSELPAREDQTWKTAPPDQSLHEEEMTRAGIHFRKGKEVVDEESAKKGRRMRGAQDLNTTGTFGPILGTIMIALTSPHSHLMWDRWEQGDDGRLAVFRYHVTQQTPFFSVGFCCLPIDNESTPFIKNVPFHGEIAVDPATGAILRLTVQADLAWRLPLERSDVMVEYHPVLAGSTTLICPSRSVSISRERCTTTVHEWGEDLKVYAPFQTLLNEMRFNNYHIFGSTSRILPGYVEVPEKR
jgi:VWFA-related protein